MAEFATLTIQRKISRRNDSIFGDLYEAKKKDQSIDIVLRREKREDDNYAKTRFVKHDSDVYYEHLPLDEAEWEKTQLRMEGDFPLEWLICFSYQEMEVIGLDMGVFQAEASVEEVIERLTFIQLEITHEFFRQRDNLIRWLRTNAHLEDRLFLCTNWIFYHEEGKYDYEFVRNVIRNRISGMRKMITCNHWSNGKVDRPMQMKARMTDQLTA
jgi:hypothetical protein